MVRVRKVFEVNSASVLVKLISCCSQFSLITQLFIVLFFFFLTALIKLRGTSDVREDIEEMRVSLTQLSRKDFKRWFLSRCYCQLLFQPC